MWERLLILQHDDWDVDLTCKELPFEFLFCPNLFQMKWSGKLYWRNRGMWTWLLQVFISESFVFSPKQQMLTCQKFSENWVVICQSTLNHSSKSPAVFKVCTLPRKIYSILLCSAVGLVKIWRSFKQWHNQKF